MPTLANVQKLHSVLFQIVLTLDVGPSVDRLCTLRSELHDFGPDLLDV